MKTPPLIAHVVQHFHVGGLENGLVNLMNRMPPERYRHAVVCLDGYSDFRQRIERPDVAFFALGKRPGNDFGLYVRLWRLLRRLRPDIVHTRNLSALEAQFVAAFAGIRATVHGEHGRDMFDLHGKKRKYNLLRKAARPFVGHYMAVSQDLERWLVDTVGVRKERVCQTYNGVDSAKFRPRSGPRPQLGPQGFLPDDAFVIGSVGRMAAVKDYPTLARAFLKLLAGRPAARERLRLVIAGDGPSRETCLQLLRDAGAGHLAWLPGERSDVAHIMRALDVFVLPSLGEGISNTILEAMSSGLPVVATRVGGNAELVREGDTGMLVPAADADSLARALQGYYEDGGKAVRHGRKGRQEIDARFSMEAMVAGYLAVYDEVLRRAAEKHGNSTGPARPAANGAGRGSDE